MNVFGLTGNPVSATVTWSIFVKPSNERILNPLERFGESQIYVKAIATHDIKADLCRPELRRCLVWLSPVHDSLASYIYKFAVTDDKQQSSIILSCKDSNGLVFMEIGSNIITGSAARVLLLDPDVPALNQKISIF